MTKAEQEGQLRGVLEWAGDHPEVDFDTSFIDSLLTQLEWKESLTEKQLLAVENIIDRFSIGEEYL